MQDLISDASKEIAKVVNTVDTNIIQNIIDKNIVPINLRTLYKTAVFSNITILSSIIKDNKSVGIISMTNMQYAVLKMNYKEYIREIFSGYLMTTNKKLKSLELFEPKNSTYKDPSTMSISDFDAKLPYFNF